MAHTFTKNHLHAVFSTKERQKLIAEDFQPRLWKYVTGICQNIDLIPVAVGGMPDHLHLLFIFLQAAVLPMQCESSRQIRQNG
jgi:putative transposase